MFVTFLLPSVNVGSSLSVNGDVMIFFSLPSVKVGRSPSVNVGGVILFPLSTLSERW